MSRAHPTLGDVRLLGGSPAELGYRLPAEFEPVDAVWLSYPRNPDTWPGCFDRACAQYDQFMARVARDARTELVNTRHDILTNDAWIRDYGPLFMLGPHGAGPGDRLACHDFAFDGWGGKYDENYADDDLVPQRIARLLDIPAWVHDFVLEGGSIDTNGAGVLLTTEACLLGAGRNRGADRAWTERVLRQVFNVQQIIWLPGGIAGDDTDGHVDDVARFIARGTIAAVRAPHDHADHEPLERNWRALQAGRDAEGRAFDLVELPAPEPMTYDYPADHFAGGGRQPCPASYANFLMVNDAVLVPAFGQPTDEIACEALAAALPGRRIDPVRSEWLVVGLGALHCLSMHQPRTAPTE